MTGTSHSHRARALADELAADGRLTESWRRAYEDTPRHLFVPDVAWAVPDGPARGYAIDRGEDQAAWWSTVYSDSSVITQLDDGTGDLRTGKGSASCSCSAPGIVFTSLRMLDVYDHHRALDVGTGTGWTAALLSHRIGDRNVVSIEVDAQLAAQAAQNISAAGHAPRLIVGDGAEGWADGAPYDRVHVTCAVQTFPCAWVEQTSPGGVIVAPWSPAYGNGQLARLVVDGGTATGRFPTSASYMMLRAQRRTLAWVPHHADEANEGRAQLDPRTLGNASPAADLAITALVPGVARIPASTEDGSGGFPLLLVEAGAEGAGQSDSAWAAADYEPGAVDHRVTRYGRRNLWEEVSNAYLPWIGWGQPDRERFGLSVTPAGQHLWLDHPGRRLVAEG